MPKTKIQEQIEDLKTSKEADFRKIEKMVKSAKPEDREEIFIGLFL